MLSRLSELTKPQQLAGWDEVVSDELTGFLERLAKKDTEMKGRYTTTSFRLKTEAWETALTVGCSRLEDWIDAALVDETSPYAVHDVANIISCLRVRRLPERILNAIAATETADDDNGYLFRQMGLIEIARSSCSRDAFESLLHFGLTHEGNVLLSTIDAITDVAIVAVAGRRRRRHREAAGDDDGWQRETPSRGHDLGVLSALRHAASSKESGLGICGRSPTLMIWTITPAVRRLEAIGLTDFEQAHAWKDLIRQIGCTRRERIRMACLRSPGASRLADARRRTVVVRPSGARRD